MRLPRLSLLLCLCAALCATAAAPAAAARENARKEVVYFGVNLRYDPIVVYEYFQPMMDYLTGSTPYRFELKISQNYEEGIRFLAEGKTQLAALGDGGVMLAMEKHAAVPFLKPLNAQGKPLYRTLFVAPAGSRIRSMKDLKGKRVAFGYHHSLSGNLFPRLALADHGVGMEELRVTSLRNHTSVAKGVIKGEFDAGALKDVVAGLYLRRGLKVIDSSADYPSTPLLARRGTSPALISAVTTALVQLDVRTPEHRRIMAPWDEEYRYGFVPASVADYRSIAALFHQRPHGCSTGCHR